MRGRSDMGLSLSASSLTSLGLIEKDEGTGGCESLAARATVEGEWI
jgi:hypothetical protein